MGGLRAGTLLGITGQPGIGKTALALLIAYMAARARAAVLVASAALDPTEVVARLAARALYREFPDTRISYGSIWSGQAWPDERMRRQVTTAVNTVVEKVGGQLHLHSAEPFESTASLAERTAQLWNRHERVLLVVDGIEAFSSAVAGDPARMVAANSGLESRVTQVAYELRQIAEAGCAVLVTAEDRVAPWVAHATTLAAEIRGVPGQAPSMSERLTAFGARSVDLVVTKNRVGPVGSVPLRFVAGASVLEDRSP